MPDDLDPILHQATRLRIMVFLMESRVAAVTRVRDSLGLTDGNLARHLERLEEGGYVTARRELRGLGFERVVRITATGSQALTTYVRALRQMLNAIPEPGQPKA